MREAESEVWLVVRLVEEEEEPMLICMPRPQPAPAAEKGGGDSKRGTAFANCKFASPPALFLSI